MAHLLPFDPEGAVKSLGWSQTDLGLNLAYDISRLGDTGTVTYLLWVSALITAVGPASKTVLFLKGKLFVQDILLWEELLLSTLFFNYTKISSASIGDNS